MNPPQPRLIDNGNGHPLAIRWPAIGTGLPGSRAAIS